MDTNFTKEDIFVGEITNNKSTDFLPLQRMVSDTEVHRISRRLETRCE